MGWLHVRLANQRRALAVQRGKEGYRSLFVAPLSSTVWPRLDFTTVGSCRPAPCSRTRIGFRKEARHIKCTLVDVYPPLLRFSALVRSLTIPFNAIFSVVILGSVVSGRTIMCLVVVITGFVVGCGGEVKLSILGVQWGLISSVAVSLNSIYTKKVNIKTLCITPGADRSAFVGHSHAVVFSTPPANKERVRACRASAKLL